MMHDAQRLGHWRLRKPCQLLLSLGEMLFIQIIRNEGMYPVHSRNRNERPDP